MKEPGYVYILTNPSFKDDIVKIGLTSGTVEKRMKELHTTGVPTPFEKYASIKTSKYEEVERFIHHSISLLSEGSRVNDNREFFRIGPEKALSFMMEIAELLDDSEVTTCTEQARKDHVEIARKKSLSGKEEWVSAAQFKGIEPEEVSIFIDRLLQMGYGAHVGTSDLTLDRMVDKKRYNVLMFFGLKAVSIGFQPKSLIALSKAATGSDESALILLENLKPFLGSYQKNKTPYDPLNGYYYIPWSIVRERGDELIEVMKAFLS
jgi:hypothetical protein